MKYIKKFLESSVSVDFEWKLKDFVQDHLVYLIDDGFVCNVFKAAFHSGCIKILIKLADLVNGEHDIDFTWRQIEDKFVPFIYMLNRDYTISEIKFFYEESRSIKFDTDKDIKEILSGAADKYLVGGNFYQITILVKE
jgi:hypothetical protein